MNAGRCLVGAWTLVVAGVAPGAGTAEAQVLPEGPRVFLNTTYAPPGGATITVNAGGNLQAALNSAQAGDIIQIQAGATFTGNFTLPNKSGANWIYIRSSAHASLPAPGTRVTPAHAALMPKIVAAGFASAFTTNVSAHHYRFVGLEITTNYAARDNSGLNLVSLDTGATSTPQLPKDIVIDRCYIHGTPTGNVRRGIALNSARTAVVDSYLSDFHEDGSDSQAIVSWNSPGPIKLVNNYLEGAAENLMFGGADPGITSLVPSDIEIRRNHFFKPLSWKENEPTYAGIPWVIKNLFELKNAQRVLVDGNIFENNWVEDQAGFAIQLTVRNEDGTAPWSTVRDVTFTHNIVRHTASGVNFLGLDTNNPSTLMRRVWIRDNVWDDLGTPQWGENAGRLFQPLNGAADITIEHNTAFQTGAIIFADLGPFPGFTYRDNLTPENEGTVGSGTARGIPTLNAYFPGAVYVKNVQAGGPAASYPAGNFFPASLAAVGFVNLAGGNYRLLPSSLYKNAGTDGKDIGADIDAVQAATGGTPTASAPSSDFNGDGLADILWRDQGSTGLIAAWLMNGASRMAATLTTPNSFPLLNWQIVGTGDFNGDGKPDILWRDTASTGLLAVWHMDGTTLTSAAATNPPSFPLLNWRVVGVGDFNGDGKPDILWREQASTGQIAIWYMNGVNLTSAVLTTPPSLAILNWKIVGTGDFNGDGKTDILWRDTVVTGLIAVWFMDGATMTSSTLTNPISFPLLAWEIVAVGDYNGDNKPDIVWRDTQGSGQIALWYMNGVNLTSAVLTNPSSLPLLNWKIVGPK